MQEGTAQVLIVRESRTDINEQNSHSDALFIAALLSAFLLGALVVGVVWAVRSAVKKLDKPSSSLDPTEY